MYNGNCEMRHPVNGVIEVTGYDGALAYPLPPSSCCPLFDTTCDVLYLKTTDAGGYASVRRFSIEELPAIEDNQMDATQSRLKDLEAKMDMILAKLGGTNE